MIWKCLIFPVPTEPLYRCRGLQLALHSSEFAGRVNQNEFYLERLCCLLYMSLYSQTFLLGGTKPHKQTNNNNKKGYQDLPSLYFQNNFSTSCIDAMFPMDSYKVLFRTCMSPCCGLQTEKQGLHLVTEQQNKNIVKENNSTRINKLMPSY